MMIAAALALVLATASPGALDEARRAFAAADYPAAERLALAAAADGAGAPALYLAGLARFRDGRPAEALEALDRAEAGADSAAAWHFNRGACLYELGRHEEAEAAFLEAAAAPAFAPLALVNAAYAALDGGASGRARALAARARAVADGPSLALVEELEQALTGQAGPAAPVPGAAPPAAAPRGAGAFSLSAHAEVGWDSDASRAGTGAVERPGRSVEVASPLAAAWLAAEGRAGSADLGVAASYAFSQVAYQALAARDDSVQQHDLLLALRARPAAPLQLELALTGQYALAGLSGLRGLQAAGGARLAAALQVSGDQTARAELSLTAKDGQGAEFASLDGSRLEAAASHEVRWEALTVRGGYRFQLERVGVVTTTTPARFQAGMMEVGGTVTDTERLSFAGHTGWLGVRLEPRAWLRLDLLGGVEGRWELEDLRTVEAPDGYPPRTVLRRRSDLRGFGGEAVALRLAPWLSLTLRHDWLASRTQVDPVGTAAVAGPRRGTIVTTWEKHVFAAGVALAW